MTPRGDLVLVRHASSCVPRAGGPDEFHRSLTAAGFAEAERLVPVLARFGARAIASSPYLRAVRTVEPFARAVGLPVRTGHELREWDSGITPTPDFARRYAESWAAPHVARPGAESLAELSRRATAALLTLAGEEGCVIVGSHGTFIARALVGFGVAAVDWPFSQAMPMPAVYHVTWHNGAAQATGPGL